MREIVTLDLIRTTEDAYLVSNGERELWLPKSQATDNEDGTFDIEDWLAYKEGLV